ncbi:ASTN2 protein, partial [Polyodon spathula]|nr:ASTN2 protein [Polyodon spathula]
MPSCPSLFRDNNFIKDFPQLADGLMVIPLPVEEQCRGVLSEPLPNLPLLTGEAKHSEAMGYPMVQQWRVRSNLYKVKLSAITLSTGALKINKSPGPDEILPILLKEIKEVIYKPLTKIMQQYLDTGVVPTDWRFANVILIHKKGNKTEPETTELGSRKEMRSMPFITYLSGLLSAQLLSDEQLISGVEIRCEEKGHCPATCHLCRRQGKEQVSPSPVLLEITRVVPLYTLIQDNATKEAFRNAVMSTYWCTGKGDVIEDWCRCDLSAFDENGLPNCSPLLQPELRLAPNLEPSSTMVAMEWVDIEPVIGCKISDFIIQHKKVEDPLEAEIYTDDLISQNGFLLSHQQQHHQQIVEREECQPLICSRCRLASTS